LPNLNLNRYMQPKILPCIPDIYRHTKISKPFLI
jgi:hypothetical protein